MLLEMLLQDCKWISQACKIGWCAAKTISNGQSDANKTETQMHMKKYFELKRLESKKILY